MRIKSRIAAASVTGVAAAAMVAVPLASAHSAHQHHSSKPFGVAARLSISRRPS